MASLLDEAKKLTQGAVSNVGNLVAPIANVVGNVAETATGFFNPQAVTPTQAQGLTGINSPNRNQPTATSLMPATPNVARPKPVQPADTDVPVIPTDPADIAWNAKQAQFDQANPVGTEMANVNYNPQPVTATAPTTTTATAKPATPAKTETVSPDARSAEINANLAEGLKNDAGIQKAIQSGDLATFRARYNYDTADQNKKQLLDSFFQSYQPTGNEDYYTMMRSGQRIANPASLRSPEYKQAVSRFNQFKKFANYDVNALASALNGGMLIEGTKVYEDLINDPNAKMKLDQAKVFNNASGKTTDYNAVGTNATSEIMKENVNTAKMFDDGVISAEEYKAALETPEITAQRKDIQADKIKYDTLKAQYDNIETDVETELKGKDVTSSYKNALIADRRKGMYKDLQIATDTYNTKLGTLTDMTKSQASLFETNLGLYKERKQQDNARSMIDYQQEAGLKVKQAEFEQKMKQQAQMASDPEMATQEVLDTYAKLGILPERSAQEIIQSVQNDIAWGMTLGQSLSNLNKGFQSKKQYKNIINPVAKTTASSPSWKQDKAGNWYDANSATKPGVTTDTGVPVEGTDLVKALASGNINGQKFFGVYATGDATGNTRAGIYNSIKNTGLASYLAKNAKGSPVTEDMINTSASNYGIDPNILATFLQADSNFGLKGLATKNKNPGNVGQFDRYGTNAVEGYKTWQEGVDAAAENLAKRQTAMSGIVGTKEVEKQTDTSFNENLSPLYSKYNTNKMTSDDWKQIGLLGTDEKTFIQGARNYKDSLALKGQDSIQELITKANELKTKKGRDLAGLGISIPYTESADYKALFDAFVSSNALDNLVALKAQGATFGALSDQELNFIKNSATSLKLNMTETAYNNELDRIIEKLTKGIQAKPTETKNTSPAAPKTTIQGKSGSYSY